MFVWDGPAGFTALDVRELAPPPDFHRLFERALDDPFAVLLDSAAEGSRFSRCSVIAFDPEAVLVARSSPLLAAGQAEIELQRWGESRAGAAAEILRYQAAPFEELARMLGERRMPAVLRAQLPSGFVGGAIGFAGYDAGRFLERLPERAARDLDVPELCILFVDSVLLFDHASGLLRCIASARGPDPDEARARCEARMRSIRERWESRLTTPSGEPVEPHRYAPGGQGDGEGATNLGHLQSDAPAPARAIAGLRAHFDAASYAEMVRVARGEIFAGTVFEVCTSQRLEAPGPRDRRAAWALYLALRAENPAAFACCVLTPWARLFSSSPERFLQLSAEGWAESRPIKGTRPRGETPEADARLREELASSEKDRAENIMIVDLVRNDLGRVCAVDSVHVPELLIVEEHPSVFQLVSTVRGRIADGVSPVELFTACFPPGSMTGAPKIEAMKLIDALEPCRRGIYAGAVGYFDLGGALDFSVVIRSFVISGERCTFSVGGAVVADSDPDAEYRESMDKARALIAALRRP